MSQPAQEAAHIVTVLNLKGGVGKTHTTWLLASVCQERGKRVLLIDIDTQGNLTGSFLGEHQTRPGVETLFQPGHEPDIRSLIRRTAHEYIDLIPASTALIPPSCTEHGSYVWLMDGPRPLSELPVACGGWTRERVRRKTKSVLTREAIGPAAQGSVRFPERYCLTIKSIQGERGSKGLVPQLATNST